MSISADNIEPTRVILPLTRLEIDRLAAFLDGVPTVSHQEWLAKARVAVRPEDDVLDEIDRLAAFLDGVPTVSHQEWLAKARVAVRPEDDVLDEIVRRDIDYSNCGFNTDFEP